MTNQNPKSYRRYLSGLGLLLLLPVLFVLHLSLGSVAITSTDILHFISGSLENSPVRTILMEIRFPRAVTALLAGSALSVSGLLMQTLFRNPLAGPSVLGITSGASLGVALVMLAFGQVASAMAIQQVGMGGGWLLVLAASLGAGLVMMVIILISLVIRDNVTLLIIGIMIGYLTIALVSIGQYFSAPGQVRDYVVWTFGSLGGVTTDQLEILIPVILAGLLSSFLLLKPLNAMLLGDTYAKSLGIRVQVFRVAIIGITSILAGAITAFCGPIGFIGIAVPHLARSLLNTSDHRWLIPFTMVIGALIMMVCDLVAKWPGSAESLPISAVTSLLGAPVVIWVIISRNNLRSAFG